MAQHATVHVDLSNKSCVLLADDTQLGAWAPGITRRNAEDAIAADGWAFAPDSEWTLTVDGGVRAVIRDDVPDEAALDVDRLIDHLGGVWPSTNLLDDELIALLLAWRHNVDTETCRELVDTTTALTVIALACAA